MQVAGYTLKFLHDSRHGYTDAYLYNATGDVVGEGHASVHHNDRFSRRTGRRVALYKALINMTEALDKRGDHKQARQERGRVWADYFTNMPADKGLRYKFNPLEAHQIKGILSKLAVREREFIEAMLAR